MLTFVLFDAYCVIIMQTIIGAASYKRIGKLVKDKVGSAAVTATLKLITL